MPQSPKSDEPLTAKPLAPVLQAQVVQVKESQKSKASEVVLMFDEWPHKFSDVNAKQSAGALKCALQ